MPPIIKSDDATQSLLEGIPFPHTDILGVADQLEPEESKRLHALHEFLQTKISPEVGGYWDHEVFQFHLLPALAKYGLVEIAVSETSLLYHRLEHCVVTRADVSLSALVGIHNELIVALIDALASDAQREKWLDGLRSFEKIGCFALTEPEHGSDIAGGLATTAEKTADGWVING